MGAAARGAENGEGKLRKGTENFELLNDGRNVTYAEDSVQYLHLCQEVWKF